MKNKENKILEELLKNFPKLKLEEKNLEEIINIIINNNPQINIDKNFKQNLKSRLYSIIKYKEKRRKPFFSELFLIPVFSIFLIMGGVFYIYKDINLLEQDNFIYENTELLDFELNNIVEVVEEKEIKLEKNKEVIKNNSLVIPSHKEDKKIINPKISEKSVIKSNVKLKTENKIEKNIEDNQIIEILGDEISENENIKSPNLNTPQSPSDTDIRNISEETMFYNDGNNEAYINTFIDYCEEYSSKILMDENGNNYCIIEEKICMENNYGNNTCKLTQKK